jgi:hypothetical protein
MVKVMAEFIVSLKVGEGAEEGVTSYESQHA